MRFAPARRSVGVMRKSVVALLLAPLILATTASSGIPGRTPFALAIEGGSFSAVAPLCESGNAVDTEPLVTDGLLTTLRRFECDDPGGRVAARTWLLAGDPSAGYEEGAWQIVEGTGDYERLRGKGTFVRVLLDDGSASEGWSGVVDFDDVPPQVTLRAISVAKPRQAGGAHVVWVSFRARDTAGGSVSYLVTAKSSAVLAAKYGLARSGTTSVVLTVRPRTGERSLRIEIEAVDEVGNVRLVVRRPNVR